MKIEYDYSYLGSREDLIKKGYADLDIHSINFSKYFTDEIMANNRKIAENSTEEEWSKHCEESHRETHKHLLKIIDILGNRYDMHNFTDEKSTREHFKSDWDLFLSTRGGGKDYFDYMQINFNDNRTIEQNNQQLNEIVELMESIEDNSIYCIVQYTARLHRKQIQEKGEEIIEKLLEKPIIYKGMEGKIKLVGEYNGKNLYGFFKKRVRKTYYEVSDEYLILNYA